MTTGTGAGTAHLMSTGTGAGTSPLNSDGTGRNRTGSQGAVSLLSIEGTVPTRLQASAADVIVLAHRYLNRFDRGDSDGAIQAPHLSMKNLGAACERDSGITPPLSPRFSKRGSR
jgi:hypothetical protein